MYLTKTQIEFYHKNGYLVIPNFLSKTWIAKLKNRISELIDSYDPSEYQSIFTSTTDNSKQKDDYFFSSSDKVKFFLEDGVFDPKTKKLIDEKRNCINKIAHALHDKDPVFKEFSYQADIKKILNDLGIKKPKIVQSMVILKPANHGGVVTPHQDDTFIFTEKSGCCGLWFALDNATKENACMWGIPGSNKKGLASRWERDDNGKMKFVPVDKDLDYLHDQDLDKYVPLECSAGSLILLNGRFVHRSYENKSDKARYAYTLHCVEGDDKWSKKCWLQRDDDFPQYWK